MGAFWTSLLFITVAELGDKTQLVALAYAARHGARVVVAGVLMGALAVGLFSVALGEALGLALPALWVNVGAGVAFLAFGLWILRGETGAAEADNRIGGRYLAHLGPLLTVAVTFFLAELGDKTMLATVTIASRENEFLGVWLGSSLGLLVADGLAILVGVVLGKRLPERAVRLGAAAIFILFGVLTLAQR